MPLSHNSVIPESEEYFRAIFESSPDAITIVDMESGAYLDVNYSFTRHTGWSRQDVLGKTSDQVGIWANPDQRKAFWKVILDEGRVEAMEVEFKIKNGQIKTALISGQLMTISDRSCLLAVNRDIDELKKVQEERRRLEVRISHTQKLESLGVLAGGIAHDFNNLLTAILGNISLASELLSESSGEAVSLLHEAERAGLRARDLTHRLLTFARGGDPVKSVFDLAPVLSEAAHFALTGSSSRLDVTIDSGLWPVDADAGQLSQVVNNLVLNADQAITDRGVISIRVGNDVIDDNDPKGLCRGKYVCVKIKDNGCGIPPENIESIFDPFFTTKRLGSGLGLSSVHSIIKAHGGIISVQSSAGSGSEFTFWIPASSGDLSAGVEKKTDELRTRSLRVLFLDDETQIRMMASKVLSNYGHSVVGAADGEEALILWKDARENGRPFDVAVLDLTISGGMGGKETLARIHKIDPGFKAIASSGYACDPVMSRYREYGFAGCLSKPYDISDLNTAVVTAVS